ncbi:MAG: DUF423 domain-containing protein [Pirellula sp.]|jgi:uncharacterized membrane protein YgdD (TMEM256/DUF423 family)
MGPRWIALVAAILGLIAVGIGAMGSHSLPDRLKKSGLDEVQIAKKLEQCEIGVKYQMYHALAMLAVGISVLPKNSALARAACGMFLAGTLFFCGGLYSLSLFNTLGHWSIVPLGGVMFMIGWILLGLAVSFRAKSVDLNPN